VVVVGDTTYSEVTANKVSVVLKELKDQEAQRS